MRHQKTGKLSSLPAGWCPGSEPTDLWVSIFCRGNPVAWVRHGADGSNGMSWSGVVSVLKSRQDLAGDTDSPGVVGLLVVTWQAVHLLALLWSLLEAQGFEQPLPTTTAIAPCH